MKKIRKKVVFGFKKIICNTFGHKWKYNFTWMPNKRICIRCGQKQNGEFHTDFKSIIYDDIFIWKNCE